MIFFSVGVLTTEMYVCMWNKQAWMCFRLQPAVVGGDLLSAWLPQHCLIFIGSSACEMNVLPASSVWGANWFVCHWTLPRPAIPIGQQQNRMGRYLKSMTSAAPMKRSFCGLNECPRVPISAPWFALWECLFICTMHSIGQFSDSDLLKNHFWDFKGLVCTAPIYGVLLSCQFIKGLNLKNPACFLKNG